MTDQNREFEELAGIQPKKKLDYRCVICGKDLIGRVRIQNDVQNYCKCLEHGLGVTAIFTMPQSCG
jgi:hypothetical protein